MKLYKIDFNNGKVFDIEKEHDLFRFEGFLWSQKRLEYWGATITEIEEPRREYWVRHGSGKSVLAYLKKHDTIPTIHVVELKEGEIIVDKERLGSALKKYSGCYIAGLLEKICKELGLE